MGCENWVMVQIGRISALHERKSQASRPGHLNLAESEKTMDEMSMDIQVCLTHRSIEAFNTSGGTVKTTDGLLHMSTLVTRVFASMAFVYLHLATQGFQNLDALHSTISEAMSVLQTTISAHLVHALVAPLFVIGCAASQEKQLFFRNMFSTLPLLDPLLQHRRRFLPVLEEIWSRRQTSLGFTWKESLELTKDIMLL